MFLVVDTHREIPQFQQFTHFIDLNKKNVGFEIYSFVNHLYLFDKQIVDRVYFSKNKLSNW